MWHHSLLLLLLLSQFYNGALSLLAAAARWAPVATTETTARELVAAADLTGVWAHVFSSRQAADQWGEMFCQQHQLGNRCRVYESGYQHLKYALSRRVNCFLYRELRPAVWRGYMWRGDPEACWHTLNGTRWWGVTVKNSKKKRSDCVIPLQ